MKRILCVFVAVCLFLTGCGSVSLQKKQYTASFLTLFDTVTTVVGRSDSQEAFTQIAQNIHDELLEYHRLFDIYNTYDGMNNLKTVNDQAGISPVSVDSRILDLLEDCKNYYTLTKGRVNVAMGGVLTLWHEARDAGVNDPANAELPDNAALNRAAHHTDLSQVILDREQGTVYLADPEMQLDVGAVAKGWATQRVAEAAPSGLLLSVGGNVCATGPKLADGTPWVIGIQDPDDGEANLHTVYVTGGAVVTSGDYQRTYTVAGQQYHHIIDPDTRMPGTYWRSVTVVCADSALADALSTGLFLLPLDEGMALVQRCQAEAFWLDGAGGEFMTAGFEEILRT